MDQGKPPHLRAPNKPQQQSTIVNGKIMRAVHAEPRTNLPSNVHSFGSASTISSAWPGIRSADLLSKDRGPPVINATRKAWNEIASQASSTKASAVNPKPAQRPSWSGHPSSASSSKASIVSPKHWTEYAAGASSSKASNVREYVAAQVDQEDMSPAHLRGKSVVAAQVDQENMSPAHLRGKAVVATQASQPTSPMNAGKLAKSAKLDSKVPCTYKDCTRGFTKETDMKRHKDEDHEWCRLCDVDCADYEELLEHKVQSEKHICCDFCGEDFRSDAGKERHMRQNHAKMQHVKCPACHAVFDKGSGLIDHIYNNKCRDRRGFVAEKVNQDTIRQFRAQAALHLDAISNRPSTTGAEIAAMQPQSERGTSFVDNSEGGVRLNLMDDDTPYGHLTARALSRAEDEDPDLIDMGSTIASDGTERPKFDDDKPGLPANSGMMSMRNVSDGGVIEGLQALRVEASGERPLEKQPWAAKLFPEAKPTPVIGGWTAPITPKYGRNFVPSASNMADMEDGIRTDWDNFGFERNPVDDLYHCPFSTCHDTYNDLSMLKAHLASGVHQGTDHRCMKCLKIFKSPAALTAHMESSSERCKIRETNAYGHILHVVSGGFLKVTGRHADGSLKVEAPTMEEMEEQMASEALPPHLDEDYPW